VTKNIFLLLAGCCLIACAGEESAAPPAAADTSPTQPAAQTAEAPASAGEQSQSAPAAEPQRMTQEERQAALSQRRFQEGTHYSRLTPTQPTVETEGDMIEVVEVFQYSCPACFNFEPYLSAWEEGKAEYVNVVRVPAPWNPLSELHARAYYAAQALGIEEESHEAFFNEFHRNRNYLQSEEELAEFYSQFGIDEETFLSTLNSFAVHTKIQRASDLIQRYRVNGTPGIVVHGTYSVTGSQAQSYENWFEIIDELAAVEWANAGE
jgi:thiol:disulfide interchange protein DsbA